MAEEKFNIDTCSDKEFIAEGKRLLKQILFDGDIVDELRKIYKINPLVSFMMHKFVDSFNDYNEILKEIIDRIEKIESKAK